MGLQITLVDDPQSILVTEVDEPGIGWVVTGPHGVDVVPFHEFNVGAQGVLVEGASACPDAIRGG